ncbi:hypothetical protein B0T25DRAFT_477401 [Lasiosphaeria hispida]|uniref:Uncharacterized protein n=1 Tax=Lasiosphaeria hispida TaxID=260671 RepID=A0AAJ0HP72_9PEZI|nr:hypothetical protein B0T25DRAFT_477401 [Lasiosphaeria hispida]
MPIAIVGFAGRFPGDATNPEKLWELISTGRNAWSEVPKDRFNIDAFYHPHGERQGSMNCRGGHFLKQDLAVFDAPFFNISPKEAHALDPQQRMALETAFESLENAGMSLQDVAGSAMGCYMSSFTRDYSMMRGHDSDDVPMYESNGDSSSMLANRVSWFFDIKGPSISVDTACSSSLVGLHLACQSIRAGETHSALVGATNLMITPHVGSALSAQHFLSPDSKSQAFDIKANGYARGEGAVTFVIKSLAKALRDGNVIRAVIRGTAVNQDGRTPGVTLPSATAQQALIKSAYAMAGLDPGDTDYFEAHGTGTAAGDPVETSAIAETLGTRRSPDRPLFIGSIKTNIGHMEGAAGLAGLVKAVYALEKGQIPASLWFDTPNPKIKLDEWNLRASLHPLTAVPTRLEPWPRTIGPRRASVNSFGYGGTNAHAVLQDAHSYLTSHGLAGIHNTTVLEPPVPVTRPRAMTTCTDSSSLLASEGHTTPPSTPPMSGGSPGTPVLSPSSSNSSVSDSFAGVPIPRLLVWSSNEQAGASRIAARLASYLKQHKSTHGEDTLLLEKLALTLATRRTRMSWLSSAIVSTLDEAISALESPPPPTRASQTPSLLWVFTGQGAQWFAMGRELIAGSPTFRTNLQEAGAYFGTLGCEWDLLEELEATELNSRINEPQISQPACTALQVALVDLLREWGTEPAAVVGHSSGEIAAAYAKGAISRETAWKIAFHRGHLSSSLSKRGAMMAVALGEADVEPFVQAVDNGELTVACINSPASVTLSGDVAVINQVKELLDAKQVFCRKLLVSTAYHSPHMQELAGPYLSALADLPSSPTDTPIPMFSSVTGTFITASTLSTPEYWVSNMTSPVLFHRALSTALTLSPTLLLEIGPHGALQSPITQTTRTPTTSLLTRKVHAITSTLRTASLLLAHNVPLFPAAANKSFSHTPLAPLVDLPPYAWNHTTRFWHEAPASAAFRHRVHPRHDLLGALSEYSSPAEPAWRNHLRLAEVPWLEHHKVQGSVLFPLAGMVAMAVEAVRQTDEVEGVRLRDVKTEAALLVPAEGVETRFVLRAGRGWRGFALESRDRAGAWTRNCTGLVRGEKKRERDGCFVDEEEAEAERLSREYQRLSGAGLKEGRPEVLFDAFAKAGVDMGPTFSNITAFRSNDTEAICELAIPDTKAWMPAGWESPNLLHPAILDTIFQTFVAIQDGATLKKPRIPKHVANVYISAHIPSSPGTHLLGFAKRTDQLYTEQIGSMAISTAPWSTPLVVIDGFKVIDLDSPSVPQISSMLASRPVWAVDITTLTPPQTMSLLQSAWDAAPALDATLDDDLEHAAFIYCKRALDEFTLKDVRSFLPHHRLLYHYIQREYVQALEGTLRAQRSDWLGDDEEADTKLLARVASETVDGRLLCRVGENLERIFRREVEPLEVMREGNLLTEFYRSADSDERTPAVAREFIRQLSHKRPLRIVEVGAGTGGATSRILSALGAPAEVAARVERYTYTDVSSAFFEAASKDFGKYGSVMDYKVLDVEKDPEPQGHAVGTYDVVVAFQVLHATSSTSTALAHCRKMLKPGGCLLLFEFTGQRRRGHMVFGTLPGWWAGEKDGRKWGPLLMDEEWDAQLRDQGFGGIEWCFHDRQTEGHFCSIIMSRAQPAPRASLPSQVVLVTPPASSTPTVLSLASQLTTILSSQGVSVEQAPLSSLPPLTNKTCISLLEADTPFLTTISPPNFDAIKAMISTSAATLWLTRGGTMACPFPEMSLITGLSRTIRSEKPDIHLTTLDLDPSDASSDAATIAHLLSLPSPESEYALRNATLHIPRLLPDAALSAIVDPIPAAAEFLALEPLSQRPLRLELKTQGALESFRFVPDEGYSAAPLDDRGVEIQVKAVGLSLYDLACAMGRIWSPEKGVEFSGVVTRVGGGVTRVKAGDRVMSWAPRLYRTLIRNHEDVVTVLPEELELEEGAGMPSAYGTAVYAVCYLARLQKGETILVHSASGVVGRVVIDLARHIGAEVYATVSSEVKRKILVDEYGVAEDHIFSNKDTDFAKGVKRMTRGRGVDVILNSTVGEVLRQTWHCIAPLGRFIELGITDIESNTGLDMAPFSKNTTFSSVMLSAVVKEKPHMYAQLMDDVLRYHREGVIRLVKPIQIMKFSQIEEAFRIMNMKKHTGKMVLKVVDDDMVPVLRDAGVKPLRLRPDATYFVPGGLGGLGRSLSLWMASRGARHFLFTSRSGAKDPRAQQTLEELSQAGVKHMVFACDISDEAKLKQVLDQVESEGFPPIRGILMLAMQLQDVIFDKMTATDFHTPLISKLHATRNVHKLAPANLDFFITTSSIGGIIGTRSQGAYAAGNTYQDALAHHRHSLNLPATSICLGKVAGIGHVAEHGDRVDFLPTGAPMLSEPQLLATLEAAMGNALNTIQPVIGLATGGVLQSDGDPEPYWFSESRFGALKVFGTQDEGGTAVVLGTGGDGEVKGRLEGVKTMKEAIGVVEEAFVGKLARTLLLKVEDVDVGRPVNSYGVDSLVAVEVRTWLLKEVQSDVSVFEILSNVSLEELVGKITGRSRLLPDGVSGLKG